MPSFGSAYRGKINGWWTQIRKRSDFYPGKGNLPGYNGLKAVLGSLYGLDIKYFVQVNFEGFRKVVDVMGGVTINVQVPVSDDRFPSVEGRLRRVYIPSGIQHMTGAEALRYARSRHGSNDFDRGARQQRVLLSLREQADPQDLIPRLPELIDALKSTVSTDIPTNQLAPLLGLASQVDTKNIRSYVFAPPFYSTDTCAGLARLRRPAEDQPDQVRGEVRVHGRPGRRGRCARTWPRRRPACGSSTARPTRPAARPSRATSTSTASPPRRRARSRPARSPRTPRSSSTTAPRSSWPGRSPTSRQTFGVTATYKADPAIRTDIIVTVGKKTPKLEAPPLS